MINSFLYQWKSEHIHSNNNDCIQNWESNGGDTTILMSGWLHVRVLSAVKGFLKCDAGGGDAQK